MQPAETLPWERIHIYWGDERYAPRRPGEQLPYGAHAARWRRWSTHVHPMLTDAPNPDDAARAYELLLEDEFGGLPRFDDGMGLGGMAHRPLFPGSPVLKETERGVPSERAMNRYSG